MVRSLWSAATGMVAQQTNIDTIANNLANVNTTGYKTEVAQFKSLLYQTLQTRTTTANGDPKPVGAQVGLGVRNSSISSIFGQGAFQDSESTTDFAISGKGLFAIMGDDGETYYTRNGNFFLNTNDSDGLTLCTSDGYLLQPQITVPQNTTEVNITPDGNISVKVGNDNTQTIVGQIQLVRFQNPAGLLSIGHNLYVETPASGTPIPGTPDQDGLGSIQQAFLEGSNVQIVDEMINLIKAERAFETNSKIISAASDILRTTNQIVS